jgi:hypothetical protein
MKRARRRNLVNHLGAEDARRDEVHITPSWSFRIFLVFQNTLF